MRRGALALVLLAGACTTEGELSYTSTLQAETQGVRLSYDGLDAYAAMSGTTCQIDTSWGCPTADADLPTDDERVSDHFDGLTLAVSDAGVHVISDTQEWLQADDLAIDDVRDAKLTAMGILVIAGDSDSCMLSSEDGSQVLPGALCAIDAITTVDRGDSALVVGTTDGVYRVDETGAERLAETADLVSAGVNGVVYMAQSGGTDLIALDRNGGLLWETQTDGAIHSLAPRGDKGSVLVLTENGSVGSLLRIDGEGQEQAAYAVPGADGELVVSGNGRTVGIVTPEAVHYYSLDLAGEEPVVDTTPSGSCIDTQSWNTPVFGD